MAANKTATAEGLIYKGHPLRRVDNLIYYGTMAEKYIIMMQVLDTKKEQDLDLATKVSIQLQLTDPELKSLWEDHVLYEKQVEKLEGKAFRSPTEEQTLKQLKKQKLEGKTQLMAVLDRLKKQG